MSVLAYAQGGAIATDKKKATADSIMLPGKVLWQPNPKKAGLYSALVPGLGQIYNRQYWKLPIVYAGLSVAGYFIVRNGQEYRSLRQAYIGRLGNGPYTDKYVGIYDDASQLKQLQDDAERLLNMTVVFSGVAYVMQVLDAITSAHLRNFDVSRDISLQLRPVVLPQGAAGVGLVMNFR
ncbi:hypothetical protein GCM10023093_04270 [Nemorincola caseinilytica]|uniref:DUF5683 domain-containing protein n=2 Tax=Nemorincola caseinilytica TaxID=2054315 RepID=A0ABP8N6P8_9BACT